MSVRKSCGMEVVLLARIYLPPAAQRDTVMAKGSNRSRARTSTAPVLRPPPSAASARPPRRVEAGQRLRADGDGGGLDQAGHLDLDVARGRTVGALGRGRLQGPASTLRPGREAAPHRCPALMGEAVPVVLVERCPRPCRRRRRSRAAGAPGPSSRPCAGRRAAGRRWPRRGRRRGSCPGSRGTPIELPAFGAAAARRSRTRSPLGRYTSRSRRSLRAGRAPPGGRGRTGTRPGAGRWRGRPGTRGAAGGWRAARCGWPPPSRCRSGAGAGSASRWRGG